MGWSCSQEAYKTMSVFTKASMASAKARLGKEIANVYFDKGSWYMWERSNVEHDDGAITGQVWKYAHGSMPGDETGSVYKSGSFRIEADGAVTKAPSLLARAARAANVGRETALYFPSDCGSDDCDNIACVRHGAVR